VNIYCSILQTVHALYIVPRSDKAMLNG